MSIYFAGGEDFDFKVGGTRVYYQTDKMRSGFARYSLAISQYLHPGPITTEPFSAGNLTTAWLGFQLYFPNYNNTYDKLLVGLCKSTEPQGSGIWVALGNSNLYKLSLKKFNGSTVTHLDETPLPCLNKGQIHKIDMHVASYGASATVRVYLNQSPDPVITYTGDITVGSMTNMDCVGLSGYYTNDGNYRNMPSEIVVDTNDTRPKSVVTLYPSAAGDANAWTGAYSDIDEYYEDNLSQVYTDSDDVDAQFNLGNLPTGNNLVHAIRVAASACAPNGSTANTLKLGVKSGGSVYVDNGQALSEGYECYEYIMHEINSNPITYAMADALQMNLRSEVT